MRFSLAHLSVRYIKMTDSKANNSKPKKTRNHYERLWWILFGGLLFVCFILILDACNIPGFHYAIYQVFLKSMFCLSMMLGTYSIIFILKLPKGMVFLGVVQGVVLGYYLISSLLLTFKI